ncbi:hypothetical protein PHLCEN_2v5505 [Hermanssonia centrifuga]|uniref:MAGE domain-containing protein n=1 Tax=Hermanssonia centrifuga TaxID=98765 RepID=A0A2R6P2A2_9APHY|nr:hypothetical protein PHLCEN_2v5505 [Hermanssonia centrifuga]
MARATGSRSQKQLSQSQNARNAMQPSQSQRGTRRGHVQEEEEEEEEEDDEEGEQNGVDEGEGDGDGRGDDIDRKASDLVRLALFHEQRRIPLRRDEISKKVMGSKSRKFGEVFARAQEILRKTFGMELVELQTRVEEKDDEQKKDLEKLGIKKKTASTHTKTFILRSVLHPSLIEIAASPDDDILRVEQADHTEDDDDDEGSPRCTGALLAWQNSDQLGSVGVLYVILALILVNGKTMSDSM